MEVRYCPIFSKSSLSIFPFLVTLQYIIEIETMKYLILIFLTCLSIQTYAQSDTTMIYSISKTNQFVQVKTPEKTHYSFFYRDLKFMKETRELIFATKQDVNEFFDKAEKVLATDSGIITSEYNLYRNKLNKNTLRLQNKKGGYVLISRETLETMRKEFDKLG